MRKLLMTVGAVISIAQAQAAETVYGPAPERDASELSLDVTPAATPDIFSTGRSFGSDLDYNLGNGFRWQFENLNSYVDRAGLGQSSEGLRSTSMMLRGLYEFDSGSVRLKPFIGVGVGMVNVNASLLGIQSTDWVQAYQVRGGVNYAISAKLMGSLGYSWTEGEKPKLTLAGIPAKLEFPSGGFFLGFNYKFH